MRVVVSVSILCCLAILGACVGEDPEPATAVPVDAGTPETSTPPPPDTGAPDVHVPTFCESAGARVCTDFGDVPQGSATDWRTVLATAEVVGIGLAPAVKTSPDHAARGGFYVATLVSTGTAAGYASSRRSHQNNSPGWTSGVPARNYEVKFRIEKADPIVRASILNWEGGSDGAPGSAVVLDCGGDAGDCTAYLTRGLDSVLVPDVTVKKGVWTKLVVDIPPAAAIDGGATAAATVTVTFDDLASPPQGKTVSFATKAAAPSVVRADLGLGIPSSSKGDWEVWYDDLALRH